MLDKGRATIAGTNGEFHYDCPLDQRIINYLGVDAAALKEELATGKSDGEILQWINANAKNKHEPWEIQQWSDYMDKRGPDSDEETTTCFAGGRGQAHEDPRGCHGLVRSAGPGRLRDVRREALTRARQGRSGKLKGGSSDSSFVSEPGQTRSAPSLCPPQPPT